MKHNYKSTENNDEDFEASFVSNVDSDANSTFDFAQLDLDPKHVLHEIKENITENTEKCLKCYHCEYKCKRKITLKKHMNTKHGGKRL